MKSIHLSGHKNVPRTNLAKNLKFLRKSHGLSQQRLAEALGLKRNNIASYESGLVEPRPINFLKLAVHFGVDPRSLAEVDLCAQADLTSQASSQEQVELADKLSSIMNATQDLQKVKEGFEAFFRLQAERGLPQPEAHALGSLMEITERLLETNWAFISALTEGGDKA